MTFISYAQNYEDVMLWRALKHIEHGFYVDVGANDPIIDSVTHVFYQKGWHGINIEPMEAYFKCLTKDRPRDINLLVAAGEKDDCLTFYEVQQTGLSTVDQTVAESQRKAGMQIAEHAVDVKSLNNILAEHAQEIIHFLKIDVEGAEESVLRGIDLQKWRPWILLVEATKPNSSEVNYSTWEPLVLQNSYHFIYFDGLNRFYIADEQPELDQWFQVPPNVFDDFKTSWEQKHIDIAHQLQKDMHDLQSYTAQMQAHIAQMQAHIVQVQNQNRETAVQLNLANMQIFKLEAELDHVYHSRSYRITAPLRTIAGKARVLRGSYVTRLEPVVHREVVQMRKTLLFTEVKALFKKNFPGIWFFLRKTFLPSFETTSPLPTVNNVMDESSKQSEEFLEDEMHFINFFQSEVSLNEAIPLEVKQ